jgi:hypothetical protein
MQMTTKSWTLRGALAGLGLASVMIAQANAGGTIQPPSAERPPVISPDRTDRSFIDRNTAITICVEDIQEMQQTGEVPETFARYKRHLRGVRMQLQKEGFKNWKDLMWGAAIKVCMQDEGYTNICVSRSGREGDLQIIETAKAPSCWDLEKVAELPPTPRAPEPIPSPIPGPCPAVRCPEAYMTPQQVATFQEDLAIMSGPIQVYYTDGSANDRLASCRDYWAGMVNTTPDRNAGWVRWSVRVRRCMYRAGFVIAADRCPGVALVQQNGWEQAVAEAQQPGCYARF